jgi:hypothetical protein
VPTTVEDGVYNIILEIAPLSEPNKTTKRGFFVEVLNACNYIEYWQYCSNTLNVALNKSVDGSKEAWDFTAFKYMCDD